MRCISNKVLIAIIIIVAVFAALFTIGLIFSVFQGIESVRTGEPNKIGLFMVAGDPEANEYYTIYLMLKDEKQADIAADGVIEFSIIDNKGNILYNEKRNVTAKDFQIYEHKIFGGKFIGYSWDVPINKVKPGIPDSLGYGKAEITFITKSGKELHSSYDLIKIPKLKPINIKTVNIGVIGPYSDDVTAYAFPPFGEQYGEAEIELSISYFTFSGPEIINITKIEIEPSDLEVVKIEPSLPQQIVNSKSKNFIITVSAPNGFEGVLTIKIILSG